MLRILIAVSLAICPLTFAEVLSIPNAGETPQRFPARDNGDLVGNGPLEEDLEVAPKALPAIAVGILVAAGMRVAGQAIKLVTKNLSESAAKTAARNYARQVLEKKGKNCFSVKASVGDRILLAADKATVLFAGNHDGYMRAIAELCH